MPLSFDWSRDGFRTILGIVRLICLSFAGAIDLLLGDVIENQLAAVAALGNTQIGNDYRERSAIFEPLALVRNCRPPDFLPAASWAPPRKRASEDGNVSQGSHWLPSPLLLAC
jgi:hypothetical protein